jgi:hypothetical protein
MNKAKLVMFIYALAAIASMFGMGVSVAVMGATGDKYNTTGLVSLIVCIIAMCYIFMMGFKTKKKFKEQGLL